MAVQIHIEARAMGSAIGESSNSWCGKAFAPAALVAIVFVLFWLQLLGHELAHTLGRVLFTWDADLTMRWPRRVQLAYFGAGPLFTLSVIAVAAWLSMRSRSERVRMLAAVLGCSAASRFALIVPGALLGRPSDERALGRWLDIPLPVLGIAELFLVLVAMAVIVRSVPPEARRPTFAWITTGIALGMLSAMTLGNAVGIPVGAP